MKLDIASSYVCYFFCFLIFVVVFFSVHTLKQALTECKTFDFSVFAGIPLAIAFKRKTLDYG